MNKFLNIIGFTKSDKIHVNEFKHVNEELEGDWMREIDTYYLTELSQIRSLSELERTNCIGGYMPSAVLEGNDAAQSRHHKFAKFPDVLTEESRDHTFTKFPNKDALTEEPRHHMFAEFPDTLTEKAHYRMYWKYPNNVALTEEKKWQKCGIKCSERQIMLMEKIAVRFTFMLWIGTLTWVCVWGVLYDEDDGSE